MSDIDTRDVIAGIEDELRFSRRSWVALPSRTYINLNMVCMVYEDVDHDTSDGTYTRVLRVAFADNDAERDTNLYDDDINVLLRVIQGRQVMQ